MQPQRSLGAVCRGEIRWDLLRAVELFRQQGVQPSWAASLLVPPRFVALAPFSSSGASKLHGPDEHRGRQGNERFSTEAKPGVWHLALAYQHTHDGVGPYAEVDSFTTTAPLCRGPRGNSDSRFTLDP